MKDNINSIGKNCLACGLCSSICPRRCINFSLDSHLGYYTAVIDESKCIHCGKCISVCPVKSNDFHSSTPKYIGNSKKVFAAYSQDNDLRKQSASGGFITSFLCYMLEKGHADAALVSKREGTTGHSFLATIDSKVFMTISIVCGKTPTTNAYRYIANKNGIDYDSIISVKNRGEGWPGYMTIKHEKGEYKISYKSNMSMGMVLSSPFMCNPGCLSCVDGVGITADMSVCDAWNEKYTKQESDGWNFVLAKTELALQYLTNPEIAQYIHLEDETIEHFYSANKRVIEKSQVGNKLRQKENEITPDTYKLNLKESVYVTIMKFIRKHEIIKDSANISHYLLVFGKILNKLKN